MVSKVVTRLDLILAHRAILFAEGLSAKEKAVAWAIVAHYNEDSGQCDPGVERLAKLLGVHRALIFRAIAKLEAAPLAILQRTSYGGKSHRNSYAVNWARCREIEKAANRRATRPVKAARQPSHHETGEPSHHETTNVELVKRMETYDEGKSPRRQRRKGHAGWSEPTGQLVLPHRIAGGQASAAEAGKQRKLGKAIQALSDPREREAAWLEAMAIADRQSKAS